jgi:hypothetical protein
MYLMYVDETGDSGLHNSPTSYFGLSGLVVHESDWRRFINDLVAFRKTLRSTYGLPVRAEIHAAEFMSKRVHGLEKFERLAILRNTLDELAKLNYISVKNVIVHKVGKPPDYDVFLKAWQTLFQRFENTLSYGNFPGSHRNDHGMVISDATAGTKLTRLVRKMAVHNPVPHQAWAGVGYRNLPITRVIEDPQGRDSRDSLPIQMCDVCAYFLHQHFRPNSYIRRNSAQRYFSRLRPVLNTRASSSNGFGIVSV